MKGKVILCVYYEIHVYQLINSVLSKLLIHGK